MAIGDEDIGKIKARRNALLHDRLMKSGNLSVANFKPATGIGNFDLTFTPATHTISVVIKVNYEFDDKLVPWDEPTKQEFIDTAKREVEDFWSDRYMMQCIADGFLDVWGKVNVSLISSPVDQAHFKLTVVRRPAGDRSQGGGVKWATQPPTCDLDNLAVYPKAQQTQQQNIFNLREAQISDGLLRTGAELIKFEQGKAVLDNEGALKLNEFAKHVRRVDAGDVVGMQVHIYGATNSGDGLSIGLANKRAKAVAAFLSRKLPKGMIETTTSTSGKAWLKTAVMDIIRRNIRDTKESAKFQGAALVVNTPKDVVRESETNYIVICHEIGHILGLPDEYRGSLHPELTDAIAINELIPKAVTLKTQTVVSGSERLLTQDEGIMGLSERAGVRPAPATNSENLNQDAYDAHTSAMDAWYKERARLREQYDKGSKQDLKHTAAQPVAPEAKSISNSSIMNAGMDCYPAHYLTIWSALCTATSECIDPGDWKITPSSTQSNKNSGATNRHF